MSLSNADERAPQRAFAAAAFAHQAVRFALPQRKAHAVYCLNFLDRLPQRPFDREVGANVLRFQDDFLLAHCAFASFCANSAARKQRTLCLSLTGVNCGVS